MPDVRLPSEIPGKFAAAADFSKEQTSSVQSSLVPAILDIITVTKDDLEGIAATIASTRKLRNCPGVRQIIIDGSGAELQGKIKGLLAGEESLQYHWQQPGGIAQAFNHGVGSARGSWVWFLNGGDQAHPDLEGRFLLQVLEMSQALIIIGDIIYQPSGRRYRHPPLTALWPPLYWVPHPSTLMKRELFERYGLFDPDFKIAMDGELWVRFFSKEMVIDLLSIPLCLYDENGVSNTDISAVNREADRIIVKNFSMLFKIWLRSGNYLYQALKRRLFFT